MSFAAREEYFATEVLTAAPQKLQLMLIEGAIRYALRASCIGSAASTKPPLATRCGARRSSRS